MRNTRYNDFNRNYFGQNTYTISSTKTSNDLIRLSHYNSSDNKYNDNFRKFSRNKIKLSINELDYKISQLHEDNQRLIKEMALTTVYKTNSKPTILHYCHSEEKQLSRIVTEKNEKPIKKVVKFKDLKIDKRSNEMFTSKRKDNEIKVMDLCFKFINSFAKQYFFNEFNIENALKDVDFFKNALFNLENIINSSSGNLSDNARFTLVPKKEIKLEDKVIPNPFYSPQSSVKTIFFSKKHKKNLKEDEKNDIFNQIKEKNSYLATILGETIKPKVLSDLIYTTPCNFSSTLVSPQKSMIFKKKIIPKQKEK